jgi:hypothetical protein
MLVVAAGIAHAKIVAPKSGAIYTGTFPNRGRVEISVTSRSSLRYIGLRFPCGSGVTGATTISDIKLKKGKTGYRFSTLVFGGATYSDDQQPDNVKVVMSGGFNRTGKRAAGAVRIKSPRCGDGGSRKWSAKR